MKKAAVVLSIIATVMFAASVCTAAVMLKLELKELAAQSGAVVRGKVADLRSEWNADHSRIVTIATVSVDECIKGGLTGKINVGTLGGEVGNVGQKVSGMPVFSRGEEVFLFLEKQGNDWGVTAHGQGKFRVVRESGKTPVVRNDYDGISFVSREGESPSDKSGGAPELFVRELRSFEKEIRGLVTK
jgi:hypothetical protein